MIYILSNSLKYVRILNYRFPCNCILNLWIGKLWVKFELLDYLSSIGSNIKEIFNSQHSHHVPHPPLHPKVNTDIWCWTLYNFYHKEISLHKQKFGTLIVCKIIDIWFTVLSLAYLVLKVYFHTLYMYTWLCHEDMAVSCLLAYNSYWLGS